MNNNIRYRFVTKNSYDPDENAQSEDLNSFSFFYQICAFPHPKTDKYHMRKFVINSKNEFLHTREYFLTKSQCKKFFKIKKQHEYKCYPVYTLNNINYPSLGEILDSRSSILNNNYDYSGYAPF